jgi:hypothetical protein
MGPFKLLKSRPTEIVGARLTNGQSAANDLLQPYGPQPHWEHRQPATFAHFAFVGCISGLGGFPGEDAT